MLIVKRSELLLLLDLWTHSRKILGLVNFEKFGLYILTVSKTLGSS